MIGTIVKANKSNAIGTFIVLKCSHNGNNKFMFFKYLSDIFTYTGYQTYNTFLMVAHGELKHMLFTYNSK